MPDQAEDTLATITSPNGIFKDGDWVESKDQDPNGSVRLIQLADIGDGEFHDKSARYLTRSKAEELGCTYLEQGDILIARMPDPLGRACIFPLAEEKKYVTVVDVSIVRIDSDDILNKYVVHLFNGPKLRGQVDELKSGSTRKRISRKNLGTIGFYLPSIVQQQNVVERIETLFSELDNGIASLKKAREQLGIYRQSLLKTAFEGKLTEQWRRDNPDKLDDPDTLLARIQHEREAHHQQQLADWQQAVKDWEANGEEGKKPRQPAKYKPAPEITETELNALPDMPQEWPLVRLSEIADVGSGMSVSKNRKLDNPITVPYLRVANVQRGHINLSEVKQMQIEQWDLPRLQLSMFDVLFNEGGDRDKLGRGWIWECQLDPCITQNHVFFASPFIKSREHSKFISSWSNAYGRDYFETNGKQTTNLASINKTVLRNLPVPLVSFDEQRKIINQLESKLSVINQNEQEIDNALKKAELLRQSILKKAFSGELVPSVSDAEVTA